MKNKNQKKSFLKRLFSKKAAALVRGLLCVYLVLCYLMRPLCGADQFIKLLMLPGAVA